MKLNAEVRGNELSQPAGGGWGSQWLYCGKKSHLWESQRLLIITIEQERREFHVGSSGTHDWMGLPEPFEHGSGSYSCPDGRHSLRCNPAVDIRQKSLIT